jgi:hypothetical protein
LSKNEKAKALFAKGEAMLASMDKKDGNALLAKVAIQCLLRATDRPT